MVIAFVVAAFVQAVSAQPLDNDYVRVTRNAAPCATASPSTCGERVLVALGPIRFEQYGQPRNAARSRCSAGTSRTPHR